MDTDAILRLLIGLGDRVTAIEEYLADITPFSLPGEPDELYQKAKKLIKKYDYVSTALLQRRLSIGYARAARLLDQLEEQKLVSHGSGSKPRKVLTQKHE